MLTGFRPAFRYYNKWVSLFGGVISIVIMFILSYGYALATFACLLFIYVYLMYHKPGELAALLRVCCTPTTTSRLASVPEHLVPSLVVLVYHSCVKLQIQVLSIIVSIFSFCEFPSSRKYLSTKLSIQMVKKGVCKCFPFTVNMEWVYIK